MHPISYCQGSEQQQKRPPLKILTSLITNNSYEGPLTHVIPPNKIKSAQVSNYIQA